MRALLITLLAASCARHPAVTEPTPAPPSTFAQIEASRDLDGNIVGTSDAPATVVMVMASW